MQDPNSLGLCIPVGSHMTTAVYSGAIELLKLNLPPIDYLGKTARGGLHQWLAPIINASFRDEMVPSLLKEAVIGPLLKKLNLETLKIWKFLDHCQIFHFGAR